MKKTSLYIDPDVDRALARRAARQGLTKAELVRRLLAAATRESERAKPAACGVFEGPPDLGAESDAHLAETGFGER